MSKHYQKTDQGHYDYDLKTLPGIEWEQVRGPLPSLDDPFIACFGGAQTFGRFTTGPFPQLLTELVGIPCLNLGIGGAGPRCGLLPEVLAILQRAKLVIVQFCAGRSASCSLFDNRKWGRNNGIYIPTGEFMLYEEFLERIRMRQDPALLHRVVEETREDYLVAMKQLAKSIPAPCVALWVSRRKPSEGWDRHGSGMSVFPQMVDQNMVDAILPSYAGYVECISPDASPQRLWKAAEPVLGTVMGKDGYLYNAYYPKPDDHTAAASLLAPICRKLLAN